MLSNVHPKVLAGTATASVTGFITWVLVSFVPAFHSGLPTNLATLLPAVVASALGFAGGYIKKAGPEIATAESWVTRVENAVTELETLITQINPPAAPPSSFPKA